MKKKYTAFYQKASEPTGLILSE